jgi:hypothetical protein
MMTGAALAIASARRIAAWLSCALSVCLLDSTRIS